MPRDLAGRPAAERGRPRHPTQPRRNATAKVLAAATDRLALPEHARFVYWAIANVLSAGHQGVHVDRVVDWFNTLADGRGKYEGPILDWAKALKAILPDLIEDAVRVLVAEKLVTTESRSSIPVV